jgi:hypothetical protein
MEKEEQRFVVKFLWLKRWESKKIHQELVNTLRDDAHWPSQVKIWLQMFRTGDLSCGDFPRAGQPPLTLGPQVEEFLQKYPFTSASTIVKHFLATAFTAKEILQRELGMKNSRGAVALIP